MHFTDLGSDASIKKGYENAIDHNITFPNAVRAQP